MHSKSHKSLAPAHLVYELVEGVLAVGAWLAKDDLACLERQRPPVNADLLAQGLHGHLQVCRAGMSSLN